MRTYATMIYVQQDIKMWLPLVTHFRFHFCLNACTTTKSVRRYLVVDIVRTLGTCNPVTIPFFVDLNITIGIDVQGEFDHHNVSIHDRCFDYPYVWAVWDICARACQSTEETLDHERPTKLWHPGIHSLLLENGPRQMSG